jgi:hypothetical protein
MIFDYYEPVYGFNPFVGIDSDLMFDSNISAHPPQR